MAIILLDWDYVGTDFTCGIHSQSLLSKKNYNINQFKGNIWMLGLTHVSLKWKSTKIGDKDSQINKGVFMLEKIILFY